MDAGKSGDDNMKELLRELGRASDSDDHQRALQLASEILANDPSQASALMAKAFAEFHLDKQEAFEKTIDHAIAVAQAPQELQTLKAFALGSFERYAEAAAVADQVIDAEPENSEAWGIKASALLAIGNVPDALNAAKKADALSAKDPSPHRGVLMWALLNNADYEQGLAIADQLIQASDKDSEPYRARAVALSRLNRDEEALVAAEQAAERESSSVNAVAFFASLVALSGDYEKGLQAFQDWIDLDRSDADAWVGLGLVRTFRGEWEASIPAFQRSLELDPKPVGPKAWMANALTEIGEASKALEIFNEVASLEPDLEDFWIGKAAAELTLGLDEASVASALKALEVGKFESSLAWLELARSYSAAGRHANAWRAFHNAARLDRDLFDAALGMAVESLRCHCESRALEELREVEERLGPNALIEYNRGVAHYKLGREEQALDAWQRAQRLDPEFAAAEVLVEAHSGRVQAGSWADHWFSGTASRWRKIGGLVLTVLLLVFVLAPFLEPGLIPGFETGRLSFEAFVPAVIFALLITLPAIRGLAVGGVSVEVDPIGSSQKTPTVDPAQILPIFTSEELDVMLLTKR
jgi:tetratricopeptide (TPR) repeat protein